MKLCLRCREEYLDHMEVCVPCGERLVDEHEATKASDPDLSKEALLDGEVIPLMEGPLPHCREIEKTLTKVGINCAVYPKSLSCDSEGQVLGASCGMSYLVLIKPDDMERCKNALEGQFLADVAREGQGEAMRHAIDLAGDQIICPACQHNGPLVEGECSACGLMLAPPA